MSPACQPASAEPIPQGAGSRTPSLTDLPLKQPLHGLGCLTQQALQKERPLHTLQHPLCTLRLVCCLHHGVLFLTSLLHLCTYLLFIMQTPAFLRSENNLWESLLSFLPISSGRHLYPSPHLEPSQQPKQEVHFSDKSNNNHTVKYMKNEIKKITPLKPSHSGAFDYVLSS